ncbi:Retrovirus-related Pol polyprotein from transposon TNT 1-94 [Vitis vinifera]|uniref:Retrovirus-related Pol polyprotein from transposon TNT 1-94 n=1 Tax=Vitis vinifera TaxID=29760 RepID=A0A438DSH8_VITVI|nr:Retrovirus-related Pol polyprotein from transposon TNT 1-94 [Vitis vinifera]
MNPSNKEERIKLFRTPYASTVASLMFVVICARLDIAPAVGTARSKFIIKGYVDSNFASDPNKRKSTRGYVFTLTGGAIGCVSKLQTIVALSTIETGCMATIHAYKEATWIKKLLEELGYK